jgi:hypothetical protein
VPSMPPSTASSTTAEGYPRAGRRRTARSRRHTLRALPSGLLKRRRAFGVAASNGSITAGSVSISGSMVEVADSLGEFLKREPHAVQVKGTHTIQAFTGLIRARRSRRRSRKTSYAGSCRVPCCDYGSLLRNWSAGIGCSSMRCRRLCGWPGRARMKTG